MTFTQLKAIHNFFIGVYFGLEHKGCSCKMCEKSVVILKKFHNMKKTQMMTQEYQVSGHFQLYLFYPLTGCLSTRSLRQGLQGVSLNSHTEGYLSVPSHSDTVVGPRVSEFGPLRAG